MGFFRCAIFFGKFQNRQFSKFRWILESCAPPTQISTLELCSMGWGAELSTFVDTIRFNIRMENSRWMHTLKVKIFLIFSDLYFVCAQNVYASECFYHTMPFPPKNKMDVEYWGWKQAFEILKQLLNMPGTRLTGVSFIEFFNLTARTLLLSRPMIPTRYICDLALLFMARM